MSTIEKPKVMQLDHGAQATFTALELPHALTEDEWKAVGQRIANIAGSTAWWIGDWWAYGDHAYGERAQWAAESIYEFKTCREYGSVARSIETSRRRDVLSFGHHHAVAGLLPDQQDYWLDQAEHYGWSVMRLREAIRDARALPPEEGKVVVTVFKVSADPDREHRWRTAAEQAGLNLEDWLTQVADRAAAEPVEEAA